MADQDTTTEGCTNGTCSHHARRTFLRGAAITGGVVLAGGALAACGGSEDGSASESGKSSGGGSESGSGGDSAAAGTDLGATSEVKVGSGKIFADEKVVVTQPTADTFAAFSAVCTHQGCVVSEIAGKSIKCGCHGSEFSIEDGSVLEGPATEPLGKKKVTASGGKLVLG